MINATLYLGILLGFVAEKMPCRIPGTTRDSCMRVPDNIERLKSIFLDEKPQINYIFLCSHQYILLNDLYLDTYANADICVCGLDILHSLHR